MALYPYETQLVLSGDSVGVVVQDASVTIYAPSDTTLTSPLALVDSAGLPMPNPITASPQGFLPAFQAPLSQVMWSGGGYTGYINSYKGMLDAAVAAQVAAEKASISGDAGLVRGVVARSVARGAGQATVRSILTNSGPHKDSPFWDKNGGTGAAGTFTFEEDESCPSGIGYVRYTWTTSATSANSNVKSVASPAAPGMYAGSIWVRSSVATVLGATAYFYNAAGTQLGSTYYNRLVKVPANTWTELEVNGALAPASTTQARLGAATNGAQSTIFTAGKTLDVCAATMVEGDIVYPWFDGNSANAYWEGGEAVSAAVMAVSEPQFGAPFTNAPVLAGPRTGRYSSSTRVYLPDGADLGPMRRRIRKALDGTNTYRLVGAGHSMIAGQGGTPGIVDTIRLIQQRASQAGQAVTGMVTAINNTTQDARVTFAPEWTTTGAPRVDNMQLHRRCAVASKAFSYVADTPGTIVDIYTFANGSALTYSINGGAPVTITPAGTNTIQVTTVTGLANAKHTVTVTSTTTATAYLLGIAVRNTTGLEVANFGYSGSIAADWVPLALVSANRFYNGFTNIINYSADGVIIQLGANELIWSLGAASLGTNLGLLIAGLQSAGKDVVLVVDPPVYSDAQPTWFQDFYPVLYNVADTYKVPLIDLSAHWINRTIGAARGLYSDQWHPNVAGYYDLHSVVSNALLP